MIDDQKRNSQFNDSGFESDKPDGFPGLQDYRRNLNAENGLQLIGGMLLVLFGLLTVTMSTLGLMRPPWLSLFMSVMGSFSVVVGIGIIYLLTAKKNGFETLINRAIRRVVESRN